MASVSTSHLILFIASLTIAAGVAGTLVQGVEGISAAIDDRSLDVEDEIRADIEVISDSASSIYNTSGAENISLHIKNTGTTSLPSGSDHIEVFVDGGFKENVSVSVIGGTPWGENDVARLEISAPDLSAGDHRVKIIINGDEEVFEFRT